MVPNKFCFRLSINLCHIKRRKYGLFLFLLGIVWGLPELWLFTILDVDPSLQSVMEKWKSKDRKVYLFFFSLVHSLSHLPNKPFKHWKHVCKYSEKPIENYERVSCDVCDYKLTQVIKVPTKY